MSHTFSYPQYQNTYKKCKRCFKIIKDDNYLQEGICGAIYCPRCICAKYQPYYLETERDVIIELYCGHYVDRIVIQQFIVNNCINCGYQFKPDKDVELKDGLKLCRPCFELDSHKYQDFLWECVSCNRTIRRLCFLADTEIAICKECNRHQSQIETMSNAFSQSQVTNKLN